MCFLVNQVWNFAKETVNYTHQVVFATSSKLLPQYLSGDWISITTRSARVRVRVAESEYCKSLKWPIPYYLYFFRVVSIY